MRKLSCFWVLVLLFSFSCDESPVEQTTHTTVRLPIISSTRYTIAEDHVELTAKIASRGDNAIVDHGFEYAYGRIDDSDSVMSISLGAMMSQSFSARLTNLKKDERVFVRVYAITTKDKVHGHEISFSIPSKSGRTVSPTGRPSLKADERGS